MCVYKNKNSTGIIIWNSDLLTTTADSTSTSTYHAAHSEVCISTLSICLCFRVLWDV